MILKEAVNRIIVKLGENPVDHVDAKHPTVAIALQHLDAVNKERQMSGWWFNQFDMELVPDHKGQIVVPPSIVKWVGKGRRTHLIGRTVVDSITQDNVWEDKVKGRVVQLVGFEDTPESFADWVVAEASIRAYLADYGADDLIKLWQAEAYAFGQLVQKEHLENVRHSTKNTARARKILMWVNA